jgi:hypothetical protein
MRGPYEYMIAQVEDEFVLLEIWGRVLGDGEPSAWPMEGEGHRDDGSGRVGGDPFCDQPRERVLPLTRGTPRTLPLESDRFRFPIGDRYFTGVSGRRSSYNLGDRAV